MIRHVVTRRDLQDNMGLWRLGQLYRVASFLGLAAVLTRASFLHQRFMTGKDEEEKQGGSKKVLTREDRTGTG